MYDITIIWIDKPSACFQNVDYYQIEHNCIAIIENIVTTTIIPLGLIRQIIVETTNKQQ